MRSRPRSFVQRVGNQPSRSFSYRPKPAILARMLEHGKKSDRPRENVTEELLRQQNKALQEWQQSHKEWHQEYQQQREKNDARQEEQRSYWKQHQQQQKKQADALKIIAEYQRQRYEERAETKAQQSQKTIENTLSDIKNKIALFSALLSASLTLPYLYYDQREEEKHRIEVLEQQLDKLLLDLDVIDKEMEDLRDNTTIYLGITSQRRDKEKELNQRADRILKELDIIEKRLGNVLWYPHSFLLLRGTLLAQKDRYAAGKKTLANSQKLNHAIIENLTGGNPDISPLFAQAIKAPTTLDNSRIIDTQLMIWTDRNRLSEACDLVKTNIFGCNAKGEPYYETLRAVPYAAIHHTASLFLRAGANNMPPRPDMRELLEQRFGITAPDAERMDDWWYNLGTALCRAAIAQKPDGGIPHHFIGAIALRRAQIAYEEGRHKDKERYIAEALPELDVAVNKDTGNVRFLTNRAQAYRLAGEWDKALHDIDNALKHDPTNAYGHVVRADILLGSGQPKEALKEIWWVDRVMPANKEIINRFITARMYHTAASVYEENGNNKKGQEYRNKAAEVDPSFHIPPLPWHSRMTAGFGR